MTTPRVQLGFTRPVTEIKEYLDLVDAAEEVDADIIGLGDGQDLWLELYTTLALTAANTKRARLGPTVTNPLTRHPAVTASAIATLHQYTEGRAYLGISTGLSALRNIGMKAATTDEMEAYIRAVQGLTAGETVDWKGSKLKLSWKPKRVPVFVGGQGPRVLGMAGRVADGAIVGGGVTSPEKVRQMQGYVEAGAKQAGRKMQDLEMWWLVRVVVAPSVEEGINMMRDYLSGHGAHSYQAATTLAEAPPEVQEQIHVLEREYKWQEHLTGKIGPDGMTDNARLLERTGIKQWLANRFVITGPPEHCVAGLQRLVDAGAHNFMIPQVLPGHRESTRLLGETVFPAFRTPRG